MISIGKADQGDDRESGDLPDMNVTTLLSGVTVNGDLILQILPFPVLILLIGYCLLSWQLCLVLAFLLLLVTHSHRLCMVPPMTLGMQQGFPAINLTISLTINRLAVLG